MKGTRYEGLFRALKKERAKACVVSSMRGTPIAWYGLEKNKIEVFSALSAAIYGASMVLHRENGKKPPDFVISGNKDSVLLIKEMDNGDILAVLGEGNRERLAKNVDKVIKEFRGVGL